MTPLREKKFFFKADLSVLVQARKVLRDFYAGVLAPSTLAEVVQSTDEALSNIIEHGFSQNVVDGKIEMDLFLYPKEVVVILKDNAPSFNPLIQQVKDPLKTFSDGKEGGYGLFIIKNLMKAEYQELKPYGNCLILRKEYESDKNI